MESAWKVTFIFCFLIIDALSLTWNKSYWIKATLTIPQAGISEPYEVWVDGQSGNTRVDYYNGTTKLYGKWENNKRVYYKIHPETTDTFKNKDVCHKLSDLSSNPLVMNAYLPRRRFTYVKNDRVNGMDAQQWEEVAIVDQNKNAKVTFTVWVKFGKTSHVLNTTIPLRYDYLLTVGDRIVDYYRHDYSFYDDITKTYGLFEIPHDLHCEVYQDELHEEAVDPLAEFIDPSIENSRVEMAFERFKSINDKKYANKSEHMMRMEIFKHNLRYISTVNRQHKTFSLAINKFADLTENELIKLTRTTNFTNEEDEINEKDILDEINREYELINGGDNDETASFDWRNYGAVSPVKDQTVLCGSCYAFITAAAVESAAYISRGCKDLIEASEQALIDCTWGINRGCNSGNIPFTLKWVKNYGIPKRNDYGPYLAMEGTCHIKNIRNLMTILDYKKVNRSNKHIKFALRNTGPLAIAIDGTLKSFLFYSKGIYDDNQCSSDLKHASHGVVIVGYGREQGRDYWILKNSYGIGWGEKGYMRITMKNNICGVKNSVYRIIYSNRSVYGCFSKQTS